MNNITLMPKQTPKWKRNVQDSVILQPTCKYPQQNKSKAKLKCIVKVTAVPN